MMRADAAFDVDQRRRHVPSPDELAFGRALVRLVLGIDALYRRSLPQEVNGLGREGWVAINLSELEPEPVGDYGRGYEKAAELHAELDTLHIRPDRRRYFEDYLATVQAFCEWREGSVSAYGDLVSRLLHVSGNPPDLAQMEASLEVSLRRAGFSGSLPAMVAAHRESRAVEPAKVAETLLRYMEHARGWVSRNLFPLPDDFRFHVKCETGVGYDAYCDYTGRAIAVNLDIQFTHEELKHLACHEAYPGHSTHILRRQMLVRERLMTEDGLLVVTDTPTNTIFEGVGEIGLTLVGWDESRDERINRLLLRLLHGISAWAGFLFAQERRDEGRVLLRRYWDDAWADSREALLDLPLRRPFIFAYYYGGLAVEQAHRQIAEPETLYSWLFDRMHSPASLLMHSASRAI
jgi:hypothetical protein